MAFKRNKNCKNCLNEGKPGEEACLILSIFGAPTCIRTPAETRVHFNGFNPTTFETRSVSSAKPKDKEKKKKKK